jgi:hypothetical protein
LYIGPLRSFFHKANVRDVKRQAFFSAHFGEIEIEIEEIDSVIVHGENIASLLPIHSYKKERNLKKRKSQVLEMFPIFCEPISTIKVHCINFDICM